MVELRSEEEIALGKSSFMKQGKQNSQISIDSPNFRIILCPFGNVMQVVKTFCFRLILKEKKFEHRTNLARYLSQAHQVMQSLGAHWRSENGLFLMVLANIDILVAI